MYQVYTDKDNNVEDSKMVAVKDKSGTKVYGQGGLEVNNKLKPIDKAWESKTGTTKQHYYRKTSKDVVMTDEQVKKLTEETFKNATEAEINSTNNRSTKLK